MFKYIFFFVCLFSQAQEVEIIEANIQFYHDENSRQPELVKRKIEEALQLSTKINSNYWLGRSHFAMGFMLKRDGEDQKAQKHFSQSLYFAKKSKDSLTQAKALNVLGSYAKYQNESALAFDYYVQALKIIPSHVEEKSPLPYIYRNMADIYIHEKDSTNALQYYHKARNSFREQQEFNGLIALYNQLGNYYCTSHIDSAAYYYKKCNYYADSIQYPKSKVLGLINLASLYLDNTIKEKYKESYHLLNQGKELSNLHNIDFYNFILYWKFGVYYQKMNILEESSRSFVQAEKYIDDGYDLKEKMQFYKDYYTTLKLQHHDSQALQKYELFTSYKDSVFTIEKDIAFQELMTQYELEKKNNKINLLTQKNKAQKNKQSYYIILFSIIIVSLIIFLYFQINKNTIQKELRKKDKMMYEKDLSHKIIESQLKGEEKEKERIAKELHDSLGAQISGVKSLLSSLDVQNFSTKKELLENDLSQSIKTIRNISHDLNNSLLNYMDFDVSIYQLVNKLPKSIKTEVSIFPKEDIQALSHDIKLHSYRIIQELLHNITKHAQATEVELNIILHENYLSIMLNDNGLGFDHSQQHKGIGLTHIKDRVSTLKGEITIESEKNKGTHIQIHIPV